MVNDFIDMVVDKFVTFGFHKIYSFNDGTCDVVGLFCNMSRAIDIKLMFYADTIRTAVYISNANDSTEYSFYTLLRRLMLISSL